MKRVAQNEGGDSGGGPPGGTQVSIHGGCCHCDHRHTSDGSPGTLSRAGILPGQFVSRASLMALCLCRAGGSVFQIHPPPRADYRLPSTLLGV